VVSLRARKGIGPKIAIATAYDATMARLLDAGGVDALMVGDSLGMVVQGRDDTLAVTLDEVIYHCRAVVRTKPRSHVIGDMPFLSFQVSPERALESAGRLLKEGGCESVKLEGGVPMAETVRRIVSAGIPVMGHVGLTPQSVHQMGGFRVQGRTESAAKRLLDDARALEQAGVYSIVLEGVPSEVAQRITEAVSVPTIGIGAGPHCDGQVLVCYDFLGMYRELSPKFVKRFAELGAAAVDATERYVAEVRSGAFPGPEHGFSMSKTEAKKTPTEAVYGPMSPSEAKRRAQASAPEPAKSSSGKSTLAKGAKRSAAKGSPRKAKRS
jgi:3-methyl-2-oxobutanoate hydroxymethyltransferase